MMLLLLAWLGAANPASRSPLDPFPTGPLLDAARMEPGDLPPADEAVEPPPLERLSDAQRRSIRKLLRARRIRDTSFLIGMVCGFGAAAGIGALRRAATCPDCGRGWNTAGTGLLLGSVVGLEVGAVTGLVAVGRERRALVELGAGITPANGIITGWSLMASQILLPGLGAGLAYGGIGGQAIINDQVIQRLRR